MFGNRLAKNFNYIHCIPEKESDNLSDSFF